jgi:hypothetical protein
MLASELLPQSFGHGMGGPQAGGERVVGTLPRRRRPGQAHHSPLAGLLQGFAKALLEWSAEVLRINFRFKLL